MERRKRGAKPQQGRKKWDPNRFPMVATTLMGMEDVLAKELTEIGANDVRVSKRAVRFLADKDLIYKANLRLRTALRILRPIKNFKAKDDDALYNSVKNIEWESFFEVRRTFLIRSTISGGNFTNSHYTTLRCKDGIVDRFRNIAGQRPSIDSDNPDIVVHLKIYGDQVTISLDSSGAPLNMRGYRQKDSAAPLNECLAAGMLLIAGYDGKTDFVDGMCGSGTLCIEAAMIANRIAPGLLRPGFAFMHWKDFDPALYEVIREATVNRIQENSVRIIGYDNDFKALNIARQAASAAQLDDAIELSMGNFFDITPPKGPAFLIMNPPYGERLSVKNIDKMYKEIGDKLKKDFAGYWAWIISSDDYALKSIGLRTFDTHHVMNGKLHCKYVGFRLYAGKKVSKKEGAQ